LTIVCAQEKIGDCFKDLYSKLSEDKDFKDQREGEVRMLVHQSHAGAIIGRGGSKIKELREATNSNLKIFQECCPNSTDRILLITIAASNSITNDQSTMMPDVIVKIVDFLKDIPIKGSQRAYDASTYDPHVNYGGFVDKSFNFSAATRGGPPSMQTSPHFDSYRGGPPYNVPIGSGNSGYAAAFRQQSGPPPLGSYMPPQETITTTQVTIPNELGGTIIGKGGERINRVRTDSGAKIEIGTSAYGNDERIITITGTPHQIQMAQYLLQQCVRTSEAGRKYLREQR